MLDPPDQFAAITAIGPDAFETLVEDFRQCSEQQFGASPVLKGCGMSNDDDMQQVAQSIDQNMALAPFDPLASIVAT